MYLIIIIVGIIFNFILNFFQLRKQNVKILDIIIVEILQIIGLVIGSKLLDIIVNFNVYANHDVLYNVFHGYMFYGGCFVSAIIVYMYSKKRKINNINKDVLLNMIVLYAIWKLGCFFNGCCIGIYGFPIQIVETFICIAIYTIGRKVNTISYIFITFSIERIISFIFRSEIDEKNLVINFFISACLIVVVCIIKEYLKEHKEVKEI